MVFLSCFHRFSEQGSHRAEIISEIQAQLEACQQTHSFDVKFEISKRKNPRVLSFTLTSQTLLDQSVDFDVLPAFDALGEVPDIGRSRRRAEAGCFRAAIGNCATRPCLLMPMPQAREMWGLLMAVWGRGRHWVWGIFGWLVGLEEVGN